MSVLYLDKFCPSKHLMKERLQLDVGRSLESLRRIPLPWLPSALPRPPPLLIVTHKSLVLAAAGTRSCIRKGAGAWVMPPVSCWAGISQAKPSDPARSPGSGSGSGAEQQREEERAQPAAWGIACRAGGAELLSTSSLLASQLQHILCHPALRPPCPRDGSGWQWD